MIQHWTKIRPSDWPARYFSPAEVACRGTGTVLLTAESRAALAKLDHLREMCGHPLLLNSGYRSPEHNASIDGARRSYHMRGVAFDVRMDNVDPHRFEALAKKAGFSGIGIYANSGFIHIDIRADLGAAPWRSLVQGREFPLRASRFSAEPPRQTAARDVIETVAPAAATGAVVQEALREIAPHVAPDWQGYILSAAAAIGLSLALWRILSRARGRRGEGQ